MDKRTDSGDFYPGGKVLPRQPGTSGAALDPEMPSTQPDEDGRGLTKRGIWNWVKSLLPSWLTPGREEPPTQASVNAAIVANVENSTTSTSATKALSANMGKELQAQIQNLKQRGRYLSVWNCATGLAKTTPTVNPYEYKAGDYFIVGTVAAEGGTNYRPSGTQYDKDVPSTTIETETPLVNDTYYYDGTTWTLLHTEQAAVTWGSIADKPTEFPPEAHTHEIYNVKGLEAELAIRRDLGNLKAYYDDPESEWTFKLPSGEPYELPEGYRILPIMECPVGGGSERVGGWMLVNEDEEVEVRKYGRFLTELGFREDEWPGGEAFVAKRSIVVGEIAKKSDIPALDDTVTRTSANGVKSSGIWSAIWGALTALPTGFSSLYDWCVDKFAKKVDTQFTETIPAGAYTFTNGKNGFQAWAWRDASNQWHCVCVNKPAELTGPTIPGGDSTYYCVYFSLPDYPAVFGFTVSGEWDIDAPAEVYFDGYPVVNAVTTAPITITSFLDNLGTPAARAKIVEAIPAPINPMTAIVSGKTADALATRLALAQKLGASSSITLPSEDWQRVCEYINANDRSQTVGNVFCNLVIATAKLSRSTPTPTGLFTLDADGNLVTDSSNVSPDGTVTVEGDLNPDGTYTVEV